MEILLTGLGWVFEAVIVGLTALVVQALQEEKEGKGVRKILTLGVAAAIVWGAVLVFDFPARLAVLAVGLGAALAAALAVFLPNGQVEAFSTAGDIQPFDERDMMFARSSLVAGTPMYEAYYARFPERKETDDRIRAMPQIGGVGTSTYHGLNSPVADANFWLLGDISRCAEGPAAPVQVPVDAVAMTRRLKGMAKYYGAKLVGVTELKPYHKYTHIGRRPAEYGNQVELNHRYALVFAVEMDYFMVKSAPNPQVMAESSRQYTEAARISLQLAYYIRTLGYPARSHQDGNYLVVAPIVAADAGLGEIGRMGLLMTEDYGPRVRLGIVTTDIPLVPDQPVSLGMQNFCHICRKCAHNCPSGSIPLGDKGLSRGATKWSINQESCFTWWRTVGTDCAICMNTCPYSKPNTLVHKLVRRSLRHSQFARRVVLWLDDFLYGKRPYQNLVPEWMQ